MSTIIGLTGGYHTGKTTVARFFRDCGVKTIDLDKLAHKALRPSSPHFKKIVKAFGKDIVVNNRIDRLRLARKVFGDKRRLAQLNAIIHPSVIKTMKGLIKSFSKKYRFTAIETPLLFEAGLQQHFDYIIVVVADKKKQMERAKKTTSLSSADILRRINSQLPLAKKKKKADFVINNNYSKTQTRTQVRDIMEQLRGDR